MFQAKRSFAPCIISQYLGSLSRKTCYIILAGVCVAAIQSSVCTAQPTLEVLGDIQKATPGSIQIYPLHPLTYLESSIGLGNPAWDAGITEIEFADLNLDGNPDIITVGDHGSPFINTSMHGITVWRGDGTGRWSAVQNGVFGYGGIAAGDVNNDGIPDVGYSVHHNYSGEDFGDQLIEVALGDGTATNWLPWDDGLAQHGQTWGMSGTEFADVNCDGWLDVASTSFGGSNGFHIYTNNHNGSWDWYFASTGGSSWEEVTAGDVNNDGYPDFYTALSNGTVWLNDQQGGFVVADANLPPGTFTIRSGGDLADVNNDGFDDISYVNGNGGIEVWVWNPQTSDWGDFTDGLPTTGFFQATQLADMNNDSMVDVVAFGEAWCAIFTGNGQGQWNLAASFTTDSNPGDYTALRVADADHNGYTDVAILNDKKRSFFENINELRFFKEASVPDRTRVWVTHPVKHRVLRRGSVASIDWNSAVPSQDQSNVTLEVSTTGSFGPWTIIADNLPNNGHYQWSVQTEVLSETVYLKATVHTGSHGTSSRIHGPMTTLDP